MKKKELIRLLKSNTPPQIDECKKEQSKKILCEAFSNIELLPKISYITLFKQQASFISPYLWGLQGGLSLLCIGIILTFDMKQDTLIITLLSSILPLLGTIGFSEITKSFSYNMWEMEQPCLFNLKEILLIKLLIFAVIDLVVLGILTALCWAKTGSNFVTTALYLFVPFVLSNVCYLYLLRFLRKSYSNFMHLACGLVISATIGTFSQMPEIYEQGLVWVWIIVLVIGIFAMGTELYIILKKIEKGENLCWNLR